MFSEGLEDRGKRFKAMLQYLILREACEFEGDNAVKEVGEKKAENAIEPPNEANEKKAQYAKKSAEKILKEMELKFYDFFVEDDLVENYLFLEVPHKFDAHNQKDEFKNKIQQQILDKITFINSANKDTQVYKESLEKIVQSPIIENSIMTWDSKSENFATNSDSNNTNLIENIGKIFALNNFNSPNQKLITNTNLYLASEENGFCQISENSIAIHAHLKTATALSWGFLNLTGKIITKALGGLSSGSSPIDQNSASPSESVRGKKISEILDSFPNTSETNGYV